MSAPVLIVLGPGLAVLVCRRDVTYMLIRYQSAMYAHRLSDLIQSEEL